jgi:DNA repair exonuclease SbcCD ATPase subunit
MSIIADVRQALQDGIALDLKSIQVQVHGVAENLRGPEQRTAESFNKVDERFNKVDECFNKVDERFDKLEQRFTERADKTDRRIERLHELMQAGFERLDRRLDGYNDVQAMKSEIAALKAQRTSAA